MKVMVTGATGLIGAHTVRCLLEQGHEVIILARTPAKAFAYFKQYSQQIPTIIQGDMLNKNEVTKALSGCDGLIHAAGMVSLDPNDAEAVFNTNVNGLITVVESAIEQNINNIVYVSSVSALFDGTSQVDVNAELKDSKDSYARSKIACEAYARQKQSEGINIKITYPGMVLGPDDPGLTRSNEGLLEFIRLMVPITSSGVQMVDARDLAKLHETLLHHQPADDHSSQRFIIAGHFLTWQEVVSLMNSIVIKPIRSAPCPGWLLRGLGYLLDMLQPYLKHNSPLTVESTRLVTLWQPIFCDKTKALFPSAVTPIHQTIRETLDWANRLGHIHAPIQSQPQDSVIADSSFQGSQ